MPAPHGARDGLADLRAAKAALRAALLSRRRALPARTRAAWSAAIARRLYALPAFDGARSVHAYVGAVDGEVATRGILARCLREGRAVICPRVEPGSRTLAHYALASLDELVRSPRGLWEPDPGRCRRVDASAADLLLVPGLAFDRRGGRLGFGAGYYDQFLSGASGLRVALAFGFQVVGAVPMGSRDVRVDWVLTERASVPCSSRALRSQPDGDREGRGDAE